MFVSGQSSLSNAIFSLFTFSVAIPSAIKVFNWVGTLYKGDIRLKTPFLYAAGFIIIFTIGGLTGLFLGSISTDVHLHDTYFIVAHFHYVMMGSTVFAFVGGMYYWWPKMFGRMYSEALGRFAFVVLFVGFNLTFFPQFIMGSQGMPRRYASIPYNRPQFVSHHRLSTIGAYTMATGFVLVALNWAHSLARGKRAPANPFGGNTLEWRTASPPPHDNFKDAPVAGDPYDLHGWHELPGDGGWVLDQREHKIIDGPPNDPTKIDQ
jgi:cytochrome c oxidase subunit 1